MPFDITNRISTEAADLFKNKICVSALLLVIGYGRKKWLNICKSIDGCMHGNKGNNNHKRKVDDPVMIKVREYFTELVGYSEVNATRFVREKTGTVTIRDNNEKMRYLPPSMSKRYCYMRYCSDNGYDVETTSQGTTKLTKLAFDDTNIECIHWSTYWQLWKKDYAFLKVNKPLEDICGFCYQFYNRHRYKTNPPPSVCRVIPARKGESQSKKICENEETSYDFKNGEQGADEIPETTEDKIISTLGLSFSKLNIDESELAPTEEMEANERLVMIASKHVKAARSQRKLLNDKVEQAIKDVENNLPHKDTVHTLVVDYGQNMQLPWFGENQPGETYYYTPLNVYNLGVVNTAENKLHKIKDKLYAHVYTEAGGAKGGNNVSLLIMKTLKILGWDNIETGKELNIVFDNCPGQNKNNIVLKLVPYLVELQFFNTVNFIFLVAGHTKKHATDGLIPSKELTGKVKRFR